MISFSTGDAVADVIIGVVVSVLGVVAAVIGLDILDHWRRARR